MTIKALMRCTMILLGLVGLSLGVALFISAYRATGAAQEAASRLQVLRAVADIPATVNPERGVVSLVLQAADPGPVLPLLDGARRATDEAMDKAGMAVRSAEGKLEDAAALQSGVAQLKQDWDASRAEAARQLQRPLAERGDAVTPIVAQSAALNKAAADLMDGQLHRLAALNGRAYDFGVIAALVWDFRTVAGRQAGTLQNFVGARKPLTLEQRMTFRSLDDQAAAIWAKIAALHDAPGMTPAIRSAIETVQSRVIGGFGAVKAQMAEAFDTGAFPLDAPSYQRQTSVIWGSVVALRDAAFGRAADILAAAEADATLHMRESAAAALVLVLIGAGVLVVLERRVIAPIGAMTNATRALACGDLNVTIAGVGRRDEIGAMAAAMQVFKDQAIRESHAAAEAEAARANAEAVKLATQQEAANRAIAEEREFVVQTFGAGVHALAAGNLMIRLDQALPGAYEQLRLDFNSAVLRLEEAMQQITAGTGTIRSGTDEITQAADDLSRRTEQQAASLEQTAAALDQITTTVRKTAEVASGAQSVVAAAKQDATQSETVMQDAVKAMDAIAQSAREIAQIIGVIDEIAFQTNLLALNAGVEAARAGDSGRGFAVVATEVRALAQRSAQAAKQIRTLISASTEQVDRGVALVNATGTALGRILAQVTEITRSVSEIAASAQEQASGLAQINTAINQMDQVTQQNAAMVEESTAASHGLAQDTAALDRLTSQFKTGGDSRSARAA